ncbi:hypothetical protein ACFQZ1_25150 [Bacillus sp. CGMCC 1.60114]|uniref:hypothetical protein n=1 Tax=unclassified Bacillus (in: firmicutes) TaxID=185979 RepID=UPI00362E5732
MNCEEIFEFIRREHLALGDCVVIMFVGTGGKFDTRVSFVGVEGDAIVVLIGGRKVSIPCNSINSIQRCFNSCEEVFQSIRRERLAPLDCIVIVSEVFGEIGREVKFFHVTNDDVVVFIGAREVSIPCNSIKSIRRCSK